MSARLSHSEIRLPANDRDVMALTAAKMAHEKWTRIADTAHLDRVARWARGNADFHAQLIAGIEARIVARQSRAEGRAS